ncbi:hypothetical protein C8Q74DRAFT_357651 [Fomes fomentarius]|nr:hypothetical protein C8Q74DRAFT_357651 [Fomes fomentarius]
MIGLQGNFGKGYCIRSSHAAVYVSGTNHTSETGIVQVNYGDSVANRQAMQAVRSFFGPEHLTHQRPAYAMDSSGYDVLHILPCSTSSRDLDAVGQIPATWMVPRALSKECADPPRGGDFSLRETDVI